MRDRAEQQRVNRSLTGVLAACALVYPLLFSAVQLLVTQLIRPDVVAAAGWAALGLACGVGIVAVVRWSTGRPVPSPWLLAGVAPLAAFELWLWWPYLMG